MHRLCGWAPLLTLLALCPSHTAEAATPTPVPTGHPRVYLRSSDLPAIKAKLTTPELADSWNTVKGSSEAVCLAFVYLVQGDTAAGQKAVADTLTELQGCTDARTFDTCMHHAGIVYDWCYPLLTSGQRSAYITELKRIAGSHDPGYPAALDTGAVVGHSTEGWLLVGQLPAGVAIHDEEPAMYDAAAKLFFDKFVPVRNYLYPAHMHHQGDSYTGTRFQHDQAASWLFNRMGGGDVVTTEQRYVPYQLIYNLRPDGQQMRSGDTYDDPGKSSSKRRLMALTGAYYKDPYLLTMAGFDGYWSASDIDHVLRLVLEPAGVTKKPISDLPLAKHFPPPMGEMVARTGWALGVDSPDAVVQMRIGGTFFGNHQRKDFGTFQIYHRGALAISSGLYEGDTCAYGSEHWINYYHQTIAHNGLLIFDPAEKMILHGTEQANDGGQLWPNDGADHPVDLTTLQTKGYELATVTAHEIGPSGAAPSYDYGYVAGEITKAYSAAKASLVTRSMVTLRTGDNTYPAVLVVFDRVTATQASFKKTWLLHSIQQPSIQSRTITVVRSGPTYDNNGTYGGKLVAESLLPEQAVLSVVGGAGKEFWIESAQKSFACTKGGAAEPGAWRVEVSPAQAAADDRFLHVLSVMKDAVAKGPAVTLVQGTSHVGAAVLDRAVVFGRGAAPLGGADFQLQGGSGTLKVLVCDLKPGSYRVERDGSPLGYHTATQAGGCVYVTGGPGSYTVTPGAASDGGGGLDGGGGKTDMTGPGDAAGGVGGDGDGGVGAVDGHGHGVGEGGAYGLKGDAGCGCRTGASGSVGPPLILLVLLCLVLCRSRRPR